MSVRLFPPSQCGLSSEEHVGGKSMVYLLSADSDSALWWLQFQSCPLSWVSQPQGFLTSQEAEQATDASSGL